MAVEEYLPEPEPPAARRSAPAIAALTVGIIGLLIAAVFAAVSLAGDDGSPEDAVRKLISAVNDQDVLGVMESLPPGERDSFKGSLQDMADELKRLQVLSDDFDLGGIHGVDIDISGAKFDTEDLRDDLAVVHVTGGTVDSKADPQKAPLGDFVRDVAGEALRNAKPTSDHEPITGDGARIATVRSNGHWYVSLWYSVAEEARRSAGAKLPAAGAAVPAVGAESPEAAVRDFVTAASNLNLRRLIELAPPDELAALHDYAPLFLDEVEPELAKVQKAAQVEITRFDVSSRREDDRALVKIDRLELKGSVDLSAVNGTTGPPLTFAVANGCVTLEVEGRHQQQCGASDGGGIPFLGAGGQLPKLDIAPPDAGVVAVEQDGRWYVSPTRTVLDDVNAVLHVLDRKKLDEIRAAVEQFVSSFASGD